MAKLGTKNKPAIVRVQEGDRANEIMALCHEKGWEVIVGIEPDKTENISDVEELMKEERKIKVTQLTVPSKNAPCTCGSGKQYKRCCGK